MSDERHDDDVAEEGSDSGDEGGADDALQPATWAGRQQWSGLPPISGDPAEEAEARADEGDEPADEFEFDEDEGAEAPEAGAEGEQEAETDLEEPEEEPEAPEEDPGEEPEESDEGPEEPASEHTVETDTLALADQEEAREAAMAGLRARTKEHAAKRGLSRRRRR